MSKIKSVSQFEDNIWGEATPIGADASNIDVEMSDSSTKDLQTVLGDIPSAAAPIQSQINTKVTASGGNIGNTTVSSGIQNFDSSSSETSTELLDTSVRVTNATEVTSSMWTKFNRFRKRVDNKFKDVFLSSVEDVASPSLTKTYSQSALNDYFANVVGYATAADLPDASSTIASQLSTLNNNKASVQVGKSSMVTGNVATTGNWDSTLCILSLTCKAMLCIASHTNTGQDAKTLLWLANGDDYTMKYGYEQRYTPYWGGGYTFTYRGLWDTSATHKVALRVRTPEANTNSSGFLQGIILEP